MSAENKRLGLVYGIPFDTPGGAQQSTLNLLRTRRQGKPESPWVVVAPQQPPGIDVAEMVKMRTYTPPGLITQFPTPDALLRARNALKNSSTQHVLLTHPYMFESLVYLLGLPQNLQQNMSCIWRNEIESNQQFIGRGSSVLQQNYKRAIRFMQTMLARKAKTNLAIAPAVARSLHNHLGVNEERIDTIPNQVGGEFNARLRQEGGLEFRRKYLDDDQLGVLFASRISPEKRLDWMVDMYGFLRNTIDQVDGSRFKRIKILLAGKAWVGREYLEHDILEQIAALRENTKAVEGADKVDFEFTGYLNKARLYEVYNAYDVLCAPSENEGFSRVIVEGMQSGLTPLANVNCAPTADLIAEAHTTAGLSVGTTADNGIQMGKILLEYMQQPEILQQLQSEALAWSSTQYTQERAAEGFWQAMDRVM